MKYYIYVIFSGLFLLLGCMPDIERIEPLPELPEKEEPSLLDELDIPTDFSFSFSKKISLKINCIDTLGQIQSNTAVWLFSDRPANGGIQIAQGVSGKDGMLMFEIEITHLTKKVKAYTTNKNLPLTQNIEIAPKMNVFNWCTGTPRDPAGEFEDLLNDLLNQDQEVANEACADILYHLSGRKLQRFNPVDGQFKTIGLASKTYNGIGINTVDGKLYGLVPKNNAHYLWEINKDTGKETELGRISGNIGNNLTAFDFDQLGRANILNNIGETWYLVRLNDLNKLQAEKIELSLSGEISNIRDMVYNHVFDRFYAVDINANLIEIEPNQNTISKIGNIGEYLNDNEIGSIWTDKDGTLYLHQFKTGNIYSVSLDSDGRLLGVGFVTQAEPSEGTNAASCGLAALPFEIIKDTDSDGIPDVLDDMPEDSTITVIDEVYVPGKDVFGTYAFEDRWPYTGDYDFNDMVVDYDYTFQLNQDGDVTKVNCTYVVRGVGATTKNGFAVSFDHLRADQIERVERSWNIDANTFPNGVEPGHQNAVFTLFEDIHKFMGVNPSTMTNTIAGGTSVEPKEISLDIYFKEAVAFEQLELINPFIYVADNRGREIHLMGMPPTTLANSKFFGTEQDRTKPDTGVFYTSDRGLPWALNFPSSFAYPKERISVLEAYPRLYSWVNSGGLQDQDWFLKENGIQGKIY